MFFQAINRMITAGTDLSFSIRQVDNRLTVAVMPRRTGLKGEAGGQIVPLVLNGTPEELDAEFLQAISTPVQKAQGILTNLETFEKQAEQAASQNKGAKSPLEKEPKEVREKREKMEKLLKKADEAIAGKRYSEALTWLRQAKVLATPDRQKDIDAKMAEVQKKASEGSLFGEEPFMQASQPQQEAQPLRRQDGQALIFEPEPAAAMPQNVPQQQPPQPVPAQPQNVSVQAAPGNSGNREYRSQPQPAEMYSFDKDDECDRELLREDPYAEYLDFPEEYRMKDEAQMETVCC